MLAELRFDYKNKESGYRYQVEIALMGKLRLLVSCFGPIKTARDNGRFALRLEASATGHGLKAY